MPRGDTTLAFVGVANPGGDTTLRKFTFSAVSYTHLRAHET